MSKTKELKLYTIYSPPEHQDGTVRKTKADALAKPEEFDGKTTEWLLSSLARVVYESNMEYAEIEVISEGEGSSCFNNHSMSQHKRKQSKSNSSHD
jgi:hypothetical protein